MEVVGRMRLSGRTRLILGVHNNHYSSAGGGSVVWGRVNHELLRRNRHVAAPRASYEDRNMNSAATASTSSYDNDSASTDESIGVTCVGFSTRGIDALKRLHESGMPASTTMWCLDTDANVIESTKGFSESILMDARSLSPQDVRRIIGRTASDAGGQGNIGSGDGCLAFVLSPSTGIAEESLLQLTHSFRAAGHFTVAAVVSPFDFEGPLKKNQSKQLVAELSKLAHVVVVLEQDVLLKQSYGDDKTLTVSESTEIAISALEHTVRCIVQAVHASEMLKSTQGGLMWHGKELKHFKRLISPPLQHLLTQKGLGVLGRGRALLPQKAAMSMGHSAALMHLASEAVAGAAESPFIEGVIDRAGGVLCCLRIPDDESLRALLGDSAVGSQEEIDRAYKLAAQASAGALRSMTGSGCDEFLVYVEKYRCSEDMSGGSMNVEATMLVLWSDENISAAKASWKSSWDINSDTGNQKPVAPVKNNTVVSKSTGGDAEAKKSWGMLSALAGGDQAQKGAARQTPPPPVVKKPVVVKPTPEEKEKRRMKENVTVGDYLAESLTAQSLDLPPAAARWRQEHRSGQLKQRRLVVWEVDEDEPWESDESKPKNPLKAFLSGDRRGSDKSKKVNVRDRIAGVLAQDRDEAWEAEVRDGFRNNNNL